MSKQATVGRPGPQPRRSARIAAHGRRVVERRQVGEAFQLVLDAGVDDGRAGELGAAMDDAVPGGIDARRVRPGSPRARRAAPSASAIGSLSREQTTSSSRVEKPQLQARGAGVDGEDRGRARRHVRPAPRSSRGPRACPPGARARRSGGGRASRRQCAASSAGPGGRRVGCVAAPRAPGGSGSSG